MEHKNIIIIGIVALAILIIGLLFSLFSSPYSFGYHMLGYDGFNHMMGYGSATLVPLLWVVIILLVVIIVVLVTKK